MAGTQLITDIGELTTHVPGQDRIRDAALVLEGARIAWIGPARRLADAGARIALGSDQHAVIDPFLEARGLEAGERLASGTRGRFRPAELVTALTSAGYDALGLAGGIRVGAWCDLIEIDDASTRTVGTDPAQLLLAATAADVQRVVVGGRVRADAGRLRSRDGDPGARPADLLARALATLRTEA